MSILNANGFIACAKCGEDARAERDRLVDENESLRELAKYAILCSEGDLRCIACPYHYEANSLMTCDMRAEAIKLGIEVP